MKTNLKMAVASAVTNGDIERTESGVLLPKLGIKIAGQYMHRVNGGEWAYDDNLITDEGITHILNVAMGTKAKPSAYYIALYAGSVTPAPNWTAATFPTIASELTSNTEGYTAAKRQVWKPKDADGNTIDNFAAFASVTMATAGSINVTGSALLTSDIKGGTSGVLIGATKYDVQRTFQNGDTFDVGYRIALTV